MKTILIATDFSEQANDASRFAIGLASQLGSNVMLVHAAQVKPDSPMQIFKPLEDFREVIKRNDELLKTHAEYLINEAHTFVGVEMPLPKIRVKSNYGTIAHLLRETVQQENIGLVVLGQSSGGELKRLINGSCSRDAIDFSEFTVLLIPRGTRFSGIHKIVFATDLSNSDLDILMLLALLAGKINAELMVVRVIVNRNDHSLSLRIDRFVKDLKLKIKYDKVFYENVYQPHLEDGLNWLSNHNETDLFVLVHRKQDFPAYILHASHCQKLALLINLPMLVIPEDYQNMLF